MTLSEALAAELARQGISLNELARRSELSPGRVHAICTGENPNPGLLTVRSLLTGLGKSLSWLERQLKD